VRRLTTLPPPCAVVTKSGNLNFLEPSGPLQACNGTALPFLPPFSDIKFGCTNISAMPISNIMYLLTRCLMQTTTRGPNMVRRILRSILSWRNKSYVADIYRGFIGVLPLVILNTNVCDYRLFLPLKRYFFINWIYINWQHNTHNKSSCYHFTACTGYWDFLKSPCMMYFSFMFGSFNKFSALQFVYRRTREWLTIILKWIFTT